MSEFENKGLKVLKYIKVINETN